MRTLLPLTVKHFTAKGFNVGRNNKPKLTVLQTILGTYLYQCSICINYVIINLGSGDACKLCTSDNSFLESFTNSLT